MNLKRFLEQAYEKDMEKVDLIEQIKRASLLEGETEIRKCEKCFEKFISCPDTVTRDMNQLLSN